MAPYGNMDHKNNKYPYNSYTFTTSVPEFSSSSVKNYQQLNYQQFNHQQPYNQQPYYQQPNYQQHIGRYSNFKNLIGEGLFLIDLYNIDYYKFSEEVGNSVVTKLGSSIDYAKYLPASNTVKAGMALFDVYGYTASCMNYQLYILEKNNIFTAENTTIANCYCSTLARKEFNPFTWTPNLERQRLHDIYNLKNLSPDQIYKYKPEYGFINSLTSNYYRYINWPVYTVLGDIYDLNNYKNIVFKPFGDAVTSTLNYLHNPTSGNDYYHNYTSGNYYYQNPTSEIYNIPVIQYNPETNEIEIINRQNQFSERFIDKNLITAGYEKSSSTNNWKQKLGIPYPVPLGDYNYLFLEPSIYNSQYDIFLENSNKWDGKVEFSNFTFGWNPQINSNNFSPSDLGWVTVNYGNFGYSFNLIQGRRYFSFGVSNDGTDTQYNVSGNPLCLFDKNVSFYINDNKIESEAELHWNIRDGKYRLVKVDDDFLDIHVRGKAKATLGATEDAREKYLQEYNMKYYEVVGIPPEIAIKKDDLSERDIAFCEETNEIWCNINNVTAEERQKYFSNNSNVTNEERSEFLTKKKNERTSEQNNQLDTQINEERSQYENNEGKYSDEKLLERKKERSYKYCGFTYDSSDGNTKLSRYEQTIKQRFDETIFEYWCKVNNISDEEKKQFFSSDDSSDQTDSDKEKKAEEFDEFSKSKELERTDNDNDNLDNKLHTEEGLADSHQEKYSRSEIIKYANNKLLKYEFSSENIRNTLISSGLVLGASSLAYIDQELISIKNDGVTYYVSNKGKQYCLTTTQIFLTQLATNHAVKTIELQNFADNWETNFMNNIIAPNVSGAISTSISIASVYANGNYHRMNTGDKFRLYGENMIRINSSNILSYVKSKLGDNSMALIPFSTESLATRYFGETVATKLLPVISFAQTTSLFLAFRGVNYLLNKDRCDVDTAYVDMTLELVKKQKDTNKCIEILNDNAVSNITKDLVFKTMVNDCLILPETPTEFKIKF